MLILGIDPGNYKTGYSVLKIEGNTPEVIASGVIKAKKKPENLNVIYKSLKEIFEKFNPIEVALESSFFGKNPQSLIRLGEVRGVIILLSTENKVPVFEYTPQQVKNAITGYGWAEKSKVAIMVEKLFNIKVKENDEADAIAVAFCHYLNRR
jgi:crossover junction endodeoxyribonuclease RuvC